MKHKHCELIKAWADGAEIQYYDTYTNNGTWRDVAGRDLNWHRELVYRIKPKNEFLKYKVALFRYHSGEYSGEFFVDAYEPKNYEEMERAYAFVMWLGEEQTVNIERLELYTTPPKREPLDDREISHGFRISKKAIHAESFWMGVRFAEKAHGIGVADE